MTAQWAAFEAYLRGNAPALLADLNPPATEETLRSLQQQLGVDLPEDFLDFLRGHDGQKGHADSLFGDYEFLSSDRILDAWAFWKKQSESSSLRDGDAEPAAGVHANWWNTKWIPFAANGSGDYLCLDLAPAEGGSVGQVISVWHDDGARKIKGRNFSAWSRGFF
ncbi:MULTISPECIES: SMI1/KNR4 family protein [Bordetella]|uniref:SMI1/KNR4 family protein n=1 Tax=Bordetella TaxID=517 RepID=UPI00045A948D|nr:MULTISPECIES: SMI1/KNR4 family protein [Bordetella]AOB25797.1 molybdenum cofactor biosynthesis protein MoeA [Bordetella bronchiseptica]ARP77950.1 molybdenum cofactor biosynthesis protein MoeA [Bordetella genomosp. 6]AZW43060.1 molybdenum cofactor biosynthesis protein MoeA [Bordetella bronchiseptica]KCV62555.1 SMI1/KNR4 family protein [Bordetella bronchiseptica 99-R-0433]MBN3268489.1 molybdenum cofactor biosynthesis protein MoeA [Bordetella bronchiseptica]